MSFAHACSGSHLSVAVWNFTTPIAPVLHQLPALLPLNSEPLCTLGLVETHLLKRPRLKSRLNTVRLDILTFAVSVKRKKRLKDRMRRTGVTVAVGFTAYPLQPESVHQGPGAEL